MDGLQGHLKMVEAFPDSEHYDAKQERNKLPRSHHTPTEPTMKMLLLLSLRFVPYTYGNPPVDVWNYGSYLLEPTWPCFLSYLAVAYRYRAVCYHSPLLTGTKCMP